MPYTATPRTNFRTKAEYRRLLQNLKIIQGIEITVAGLLVFARQPQAALPTARSDFAIIEGRTLGENFLDHQAT